MIPYQFLITIRLGTKSLMLHKLRSSLTMLGIIFGVCSVIAMLAIGEGASYEAQEAIKKLDRFEELDPEQEKVYAKKFFENIKAILGD